MVSFAEAILLSPQWGNILISLEDLLKGMSSFLDTYILSTIKTFQ